MIKGVSKQVIEVSDPHSIYYERAWLVVKPQYTKVQQSILDREAKTLLSGMSPPSCMKPKRSFGFWFLRLGASALCGAAVTLAVTLLV